MISVVIPVYNAEHSIKKLVRKIIEVFKEMEIEIILVNDESVHRIASEQTLEIMNEDTGERDPLWNNDRLWGTSLYRCFLLRDIAKTFAEDEPYIHFDSDVILFVSLSLL